MVKGYEYNKGIRVKKRLRTPGLDEVPSSTNQNSRYTRLFCLWPSNYAEELCIKAICLHSKTIQAEIFDRRNTRYFKTFEWQFYELCQTSEIVSFFLKYVFSDR